MAVLRGLYKKDRWPTFPCTVPSNWGVVSCLLHGIVSLSDWTLVHFHQQTLNSNILHLKLNSACYNNCCTVVMETFKSALKLVFCSTSISWKREKKIRKWTVSMVMVRAVKSQPKTIIQSAPCSLRIACHMILLGINKSSHGEGKL